jgi:hypothetical protein
MSFLLEVLFFYVGVQSPFLIYCAYPLLKKAAWIASPKLVFPVVTFTCVFFYLTRAFNSHFLFADIFILSCYSLLTFRSNYSRLDALVLSALTMIAVDQIWQFPLYLFETVSLQTFENWFISAAWNLMSIPLLFYFVLRINGRIKMSGFGKQMLAISLSLTVFDILLYSPSLASLWLWYDTYFLVPVWGLFFLSVFVSSPYMLREAKI